MARNKPPIIVRLRRSAANVGRKISRFGAALVWPIERAFAFLGQLGMSATQRVEGTESLLLRLGYTLTWPLRMLWALFVRIADVFLPKSVRGVLLAPFRGLSALGNWTGRALMRVAEKTNLDGPLLWIARHTKWIWYPFAALANFLQAWLITRNYKQMLWGTPAVLIMLPVLGAVTWSKLWGQGSIAADYRLAVKQALEDKDFRRVQLYQQKLAQLGADSQMTDFQTAAALANDGKIDEAFERMQRMAPEDEPGYGPAHSWILQNVLEGKLGLSNAETQRLMGVHIKHLQSLGAKGPEIELLRALWLARDKQVAEASRVLQPLVNRLPSAAVMRMEIDLSLGQVEEARSDARAIRVHMNDRSRRDAKLSALDCRSWAIAEELLGNLDASRDLVRKWLKLEPDNHEARKSLSLLCQREFQEVLSTPDPDPQELADLFVEAAELTDDPHVLQRQVGFLYRQRERIPVANRVIELITGSPRTESAILEAAGTAAAEAGNFDQGRTYLQEAVKKDPKNAIAWNNYAYIVMQDESPDYEEAFQAVNQAVEILPEEFHFRETRGQVLVHLKRWKEAIPDLEFALNGMPTSRAIHQALATAYDEIGEPQLARLHRQQAQ